MSETVISVENLSKQYRLGVIGSNTLRDDAARFLARLRGKPDPTLKIGQTAQSPIPNPQSPDTIWALKDVSFEVKQGEVVGIIGRNGAGKSTLLKILSRITAPTSGHVKVKGRIASLLEVGTGFHPELTGRENIYLNGAILGMTKAEVDRKFDEIVDFSGVEQFIDTPVKRYSSGMYVRLAFAVAAHLEPEILLVDEVLAVGDAAFQKKCLGKMGDVAQQGRTVLFVSHNMGAVRALCPRCLLFENGCLEMSRESETVILKYLSSNRNRNGHIDLLPIDSDAHFTSVSIVGPDGTLSESIDVRLPFVITFRYHFRKTIENAEISFSLFDSYGSKVFYCPRSNSAKVLDHIDEKGDYLAEVTIPASFLAPGYYAITAAIHQPNTRLFDVRNHVIGFQVIESGTRHYAFVGKNIGSVLVDFQWKVRNV